MAPSTQPLTRLRLGNGVSCVDGPFGELADIVLDPKQRRVTHLVIQAMRLPGSRRLAPIQLAVNRAHGSEVVLRCTVKTARELPSVQEVASLPLGQLPTNDPQWDVGVQEVTSTPHYDAGAMVEYYPEVDPDITIVYDRVPKGEVEIRHGSEVTAADGHDAGRVRGMLVDDGQITHLVLRRGYLWRRRELTVPIAAVETLSTDNVTLKLTNVELKSLRSQRVRR